MIKFQSSLLTLAVSSALAFSSSVFAAPIQGKVVDQHGKPIANAKVHVHGRQQYVFTNQQGQFSLDVPADAELHIAAKGHVDQFVPMHTLQQNTTVTLPRGEVEHLHVRAAGLHHYDLDMAQPVSVMSDEDLSRHTEPTLGETLKVLPGVHSNYYGPVAASPVIRGLDGPRVKVLANGLETGDVSRFGPDHAIAADAITTEQIEVMRGPATLLYGSGAIGGVVNVVDNRIPRQKRAPQTQVEGRYNSVSDERTYAISHDGSAPMTANLFGDSGKTPDVAWHFDAFDRQTHDVSVPEFTLPDGDKADRIDNSWIESNAINAGLSLSNSKGLLGFSIGQLESQYGIPAHGHHDEHDAELLAEPDVAHDEDAVYANVKQNRYALSGELYSPLPGVEAINLHIAATDFSHQEIEGSTTGTEFDNDSLESRLTVEHATLAGWHGLVGMHITRSDYRAQGEEAFTPDTDSQSQALFILEEYQWQQLSWQLGGRIENTQHDAGVLDLTHSQTVTADQDFSASSLSAGALWQYQPGYHVGLALAHSERAPSAAELFANGTHLATQSYELGLAYALDADGEISANPNTINTESALNLDLSWRKSQGDFSFGVNLFYNQIDDYIFQANTGLAMDDLAEHDHEHDDHGADAADEHEHEHEHEHEAFMVYQARQADVTMYGVELQLGYQLTDNQTVHVFADSINAKLDAGGYLPRIPPIKLGAEYEWRYQDYQAVLGFTHYGKQDKVAIDETSTASYRLLDLTVSYDFMLPQAEFTSFLRLNNLTDELGFVHSSFIKTQAPLPGRSVTLGLKARF